MAHPIDTLLRRFLKGVNLVEKTVYPTEFADAVDGRITALSTVSDPPEGYFRVTNIYVDSKGKLVVEYDDGG